MGGAPQSGGPLRSVSSGRLLADESERCPALSVDRVAECARLSSRGSMMKDPLLQGSVAVLPGASLQKACRLLVLFCALHLSVTLVYYMFAGGTAYFTEPLQLQFRPRANSSVGPLVTVLATTEENATQEPTTPAIVNLADCPATSPLLVGPLRIEFSIPVDLEQVRKTNPNVREGGRYKPKDCKALQKVALIIPFRKRDEHLKFWLHYLHPILQRQQLDYGVYVINQDGDETFNRAKLLNIGYMEALKEYDYNCFVFSDVDLIPMDDRNIYKCYSQPRHLSVSMDKFGFGLPYNQYFGGVSALSKEQFEKINGFPNNFWGWGGEDDDIYNRIVSRGMSISRPDAITGKCRMIRHERDAKNDPNPRRFDLIAHTRKTMNSDGINSLNYRVVKTEKFPLFTEITVDVGSSPS
ncbi:beta-1,4-galactosyltransferase 1 [Bufo gargarizans]|uniref:beta-1,4-galactosyltransferase 1 n=1 Tax=Bufo gargarizans TaxID=30331 RepID=UPI001CF3A298|nr:beta-1,4-galactosyltransferase 1 [Bufo gargarizans]